jgi:lipopolysaccharide/colanic/teichoic acid biosynthesis glycosyltransferase/glycosyltransferase involved in cell wall biosynthesis
MIPKSPTPVRVLLITTASQSLILMRGQAGFLRARGFDVTVIASPGVHLVETRQTERVETLAIPIAREISPLRDLQSLWRLFRVIRRLRPAITDVRTPKAGLLGGIAARLNRVPCRIYSLFGLRCETATGLKRWLLLFCEWIACACAHQVICSSESLRRKAVALGIADVRKTLVIGPGSANGVDASRFVPTPEILSSADKLRLQLGIAREARVIGFVGRLTQDKGIADLLKAFALLRPEFPDLRLLLVGEFEDGDPVSKVARREILENPLIIQAGFISDINPAYQLMDVVALPSYREGFPTAVLEAHAAGKPVVAARATGNLDAVQDEVDGILVPVKNASALSAALARILRDADLAQRFGTAGRERVLRDFQQQAVWRGLETAYSNLLTLRGIKAASFGESESHPRGSTTTRSPSSRRLKSVADFGIALVALIALSPLLAIVAASVLLSMGTPVFFRQKRAGLHGRIFTLLKFRTMSASRDSQNNLLPDEVRLTKLGKFLRQCSLDELPQLWNVLTGDMSFVGPRPLLADYLPRYSPEQSRRHAVKPGITGWAQVNGRNSLAWEEKFQLDLWYVDHASLVLDTKIIALTVKKLIHRSGISQDGCATMPEFRGARSNQDASAAVSIERVGDHQKRDLALRP